jgi:3-hydroxyisobutyrate dehydrogenase-like beta-hydroxyacid dehydrogenase
MATSTRARRSPPKSKKTRREPVGVIGLGIMGSAMAANLVRAGYRVVGYDVLPDAARRLKREGGESVTDVRGVAEAATTIITSLPSANALMQVATELAQFGRKVVVIETSTLPIDVKEQARTALARRGATLLDCPLSGTGAQARTKDIAVYTSGDAGVCRSIVPILEGFSRVNYYVGPFGNGSKMKFAANLLVAIHNVAAAEAMVLAMKSGLDPALSYKVLTDGAGNSRMFQVRGPMMVKGDYSSDVTMKLAVWQKDMNVIADFAKANGCPTPLFAATAPLYLSATANDPMEDTGAVCAVIEKARELPAQATVVTHVEAERKRRLYRRHVSVAVSSGG